MAKDNGQGSGLNSGIMDSRGYVRQKAAATGKGGADMQIVRRVRGSLTAKIVIVLGTLIIVGGSTFWYVSIQNNRRNLMDNTITFVSSFSEIVRKSIRNDMLRFQRGDIQSTIESIGASKSIAKVQVLDAKGVIFHSSDREEIGRRVDLASRACTGCHGIASVPGEVLTREKQWDIYTHADGHRVLSFVEPIYNEPACSSASCHAHDRGQKVLGMLITDFSLLPIDMKTREQIVETSVCILFFLTVASAILYYIMWRFVLRPVKSLSLGMKNVASGDLLQRVTTAADDEIGRLARTFNSMTGELNDARQRMEQWNLVLQEEVRKKTEEIIRTHGKLIQAEKLAALGRLTADIAHEIRNPLTALGGFGRRLQKIASSEKEKTYSDIIVSEVCRLEKILRDIMMFSREEKTSFKKIPVTDMVRESIVTFSALCDEHAIALDARYLTDLPVFIDTSQAKQAVNNLISNAIDVMTGGGVLSVTTAPENCHHVTFVAVHVSDTGPGIQEDKLPYIFEPFYTTKEIGRGTGLGLSISRKIIEEHGGFISARNRDGRGLTASLYFPYQSEEDLCRVPCWEFMGCGRDMGRDTKCPVYPYFGRVCWVVGGTYCEGRVQGTYAQKCEDCQKCAFYQQVLSGDI